MLQKEIERNFSEIERSLECQTLREIQLLLRENEPVEEIKKRYENKLNGLNDLEKRAQEELKSLYKCNYESKNFNMNSGKVYGLLEQIKYVKGKL